MERNDQIEVLNNDMPVEQQQSVSEPDEVSVSKNIPTIESSEAVDEAAAAQQIIQAAKEEHNEPVLPVTAETVEIVAPAEKPKKKKGFLKMFISAVLACGVVAGGLWAARTYLVLSPETVIKQACAATIAKQQQYSKTITEAVPVCGFFGEGYTYQDGEASFKLKIDSIEEIPYSRMVSALLSGFEFSGQTSASAANNASALSAKIDYDGNALLSANIYFSPDLVTLSVPELTEKVLSVVPSTIAEDYPDSFFGSVYPIDRHSLQQLQDSFADIFEQRRAYTPEALEDMKNDMAGIAASAFKNAKYGYNKDSKLYAVELPGADVKGAVIELFRYIYLDSVMASAMEQSISASFAAEGVENYQQLVDKMIADMQNSIDELPVSISLDIENKLIRDAAIVCLPGEQGSVKRIAADIALSDVSNVINLSAVVSDGDEDITMLMDVVTDFKNDVFTTDIDLSASDESSSFNMPLNISVSATGDYSCEAAFNFDDGYKKSLLGFSSDGVVKMEENTLTYDLSDCSLRVGFDDDAPIVLNFSVSGERAPLSAAPAAPSDHTELLTMPEEVLWQLAYQCYNNLGEIAKLINSLLIGF